MKRLSQTCWIVFFVIGCVPDLGFETGDVGLTDVLADTSADRSVADNGGLPDAPVGNDAEAGVPDSGEDTCAPPYILSGFVSSSEFPQVRVYQSNPFRFCKSISALDGLGTPARILLSESSDLLFLSNERDVQGVLFSTEQVVFEKLDHEGGNFSDTLVQEQDGGLHYGLPEYTTVGEDTLVTGLELFSADGAESRWTTSKLPSNIVGITADPRNRKNLLAVRLNSDEVFAYSPEMDLETESFPFLGLAASSVEQPLLIRSSMVGTNMKVAVFVPEPLDDNKPAFYYGDTSGLQKTSLCAPCTLRNFDVDPGMDDSLIMMCGGRGSLPKSVMRQNMTSGLCTTLVPSDELPDHWMVGVGVSVR